MLLNVSNNQPKCAFEYIFIEFYLPRCCPYFVYVFLALPWTNTPLLICFVVERFSIEEASETDTLIAALPFTDADAGDNSKLTYKVDSGFFAINETGHLTVGVPLDRETPPGNRHDIVVTVCDSGVPPNCTDTHLTINVIDVNDNAPEFHPPDSRTIVSESVQCSHQNPLMELSFTDADEGENSRLTYDVLK